jgi:hypothetical protein
LLALQHTPTHRATIRTVRYRLPWSTLQDPVFSGRPLYKTQIPTLCRFDLPVLAYSSSSSLHPLLFYLALYLPLFFPASSFFTSIQLHLQQRCRNKANTPPRRSWKNSLAPITPNPKREHPQSRMPTYILRRNQQLESFSEKSLLPFTKSVNTFTTSSLFYHGWANTT